MSDTATRVRAALVGLHASRFDPYTRAVLGWLLSACVVDGDAVVWTGRLGNVAAGSCVSLRKVHGLFGALIEAGIATKTRIEGGVRVVLCLDEIEAGIGEPPTVVICQACGDRGVEAARGAADQSAPHAEGVCTTRTLGMHGVHSLARAGVTSHSETTSLRGDDAQAREDTTTTTTTGVEDGDGARRAVSKWCEVARTTMPRDRDVTRIMGHVSKHGAEVVVEALSLIADYCTDSRRTPQTAWLPDRIEQVLDSRKSKPRRPRNAAPQMPTAADYASIDQTAGIFETPQSGGEWEEW